MSSNYVPNLWGKRSFQRAPNAFLLATVVSGFAWYFNSRRASDFSSRQAELIRRVEQDETVDAFKTTFDYHKAEDWECKKVNLDGVLKEGRFFVKRNRGKQEGYYVLAPFVVNSTSVDTQIFTDQGYNARTSHRKFIINLGWIPRSRKYLVYDTIYDDAFGEQVYEDRNEAYKKQQQDGLVRDPLAAVSTVPITNITAYVRKGEAQDLGNGRINWRDNYLYKWIDLTLLTRVFRVFNEEEGQAVYLERSVKSADEPECFPLSATKESVIEELNTQNKNFQNNAGRVTKAISGFAFTVAAWMTFL